MDIDKQLSAGKNIVVIHDTPRDMTDVGIDIDEQRKRKVFDIFLPNYGKLTVAIRLLMSCLS